MAVLGSITLNEIVIYEVDANPTTGGGLDAPSGSMAILTDGSGSFLKGNGGPTDWTNYPEAARLFAIQRANHTGTQAISTVTGLQTSLDAKSNLAGGNTFTGNQIISDGLTMNSTTEPFLPPRVTSAQRAAIGGIGSVVYDTTVGALFVRVGGSINDWHRIPEARTRTFNLANFATSTLVIGNFEFRYSTNTTGGNLQVRALTSTQTINWYAILFGTSFAGSGGARNDILTSGFTSLTAVTYLNNYKGLYEIHNITDGAFYRVSAVLDNNATFTIRAEIF